MESLIEELTLSDLNNRIASTKTYIDNVNRYAADMRAFLPVFSTSGLPIKYDEYDGIVAYIGWILRSDELYLCLNVTYCSTGKFKCAQTLSQLLTLTELTDRRNIRTLGGKQFKQYYARSASDCVYSVVSDRIVSPRSFAIIENGMEAFKSRDKILKRFDVQSPLVGV